MARRRSNLDPAIKRARLDSLQIFEISEAELEALERGSTESVFLNLAIFTISVAISLSASLATASFQSDRTFYVFVILTSLGFLSGLTFTLLWFLSRRTMRDVSATIRSRIPPDGTQESDSPEPESPGRK